MGATRSQLITQYKRAKSHAWTEHFREAANTITAGYFDTADLMAIGSRETNLDPKWLTKKGDNGHGAGLMQIDDRSFPEFTNSTKWKDARLGILKGAEVLMQKWNDLQKNAGKTLKVKTYSFKGPYVSGVTAQQIAIAAYNSGRWAAYHYTKGRHPDYGTTGKDYSADVMARARVFRELLGKDGMLDYPKDSASAVQLQGGATATEAQPDTTTSLDTSVQPQTPIETPQGNVTADTVQINQGDTASVAPPPTFVAEDKTLEAPAKDATTATATRTTIFGIAIPAGIYAFFKAVQEWVEKGFIDVKEVIAALLDLIRNNVKYVTVLAGMIIGILALKKIFKQVTFLLELYINSRPDLHNVKVVPGPTDAKKWWEVWK